ncbi:MAG: HTH domain-containing protein, partial [Clostridia bacterium]|nr:HTH domain-containing protein [Clostridia bacterium]
MKAEERRKNITLLLSADKPVPGGVLSQRLGVSRQIIGQDIARLKEAGYEILATHTGYLLKGSPLAERVLQVFHTTEQTEDELSCIVSLGGTVADVHVWHKVYGKLSAP